MLLAMLPHASIEFRGDERVRVRVDDALSYRLLALVFIGKGF